MHVTGFSFKLPESLVTHYPMPEHSSCRLLSLDGPTSALTHDTFIDLFDKFNPGDLLVFNDTRVALAHLFGRKASGGKIKVLVERMFDEKCIFAYIRASKTPKPDAELPLDDDESINTTVTTRHNALFEAKFNDDCSVLGILNSIGHIPLLPCIDRPDGDANRELHQTAYSEKSGMVAAPIAGLHLDEPLLEKLRTKDAKMAFMMLHVGVGAFQPMHVDTIEGRIMHLEYAKVPQDVVDAILTAKTRGNRVIMASTTPVCSLESVAQAAKNDPIEPFSDNTQIFICSSSQYEVVDALMTNFRLLESTLVILVSAFAGYQHTMNAYKTVVEEKYHFSNHDDTMFITCSPQAINERVGE